MQAFKQCRPHLQIICTYGGTSHPIPLQGGAALQKVSFQISSSQPLCGLLSPEGQVTKYDRQWGFSEGRWCPPAGYDATPVWRGRREKSSWTSSLSAFPFPPHLQALRVTWEPKQQNSPRLSPLQVKIIILYNICKWHYLLHPPKTVHDHNYRLFSCYSDLVSSQTNKQTKNILFIYLAQMLYSHFWTFPMFLLKVSLFQRDLKVGFTELIQCKSRFVLSTLRF